MSLLKKIYAGIDIGASSTDVVLIDQRREILGFSILPTVPIHQLSSDRAVEAACNIANCSPREITCFVSTGYGRKNVRNVSSQITEISCHARGSQYYFSDTRTVLDVGGQDSKVIRTNEKGTVEDFLMNEKCAAGTGRFLEAMAKILEVELEEMGTISTLSTIEFRLSSVCTVFAESEVISKIAEGGKVPDIINGIHHSICDRTIAMLRKVKIEPALIMTGGVAKNIGIVQLLENKLGLKIKVPDEPQLVGALGAALYALEKASA